MACAKSKKRAKAHPKKKPRGGAMAEVGLRLPSRKVASRKSSRKTGARLLKVRGTSRRGSSRKC